MMKHGSAGSGRNSQKSDNRKDSPDTVDRSPGQGVDTRSEQRPEQGVEQGVESGVEQRPEQGLDEVDERRKKHQTENSPARKLDLPDPPDPDNLPINYPATRKPVRPHGIEWP
ncbi:hypothetical protein [Arthrobacter sp. NyZ413]|uniref:hypothetical protein n=1 Tax=Arthrobacter sp. NyZ413 TaxID=3144669 RepID=UPI003BF84FF4